MNQITIMPEKKKIAYEPGKSLLEILVEAGIWIEAPCGGQGVCGKCKVKIKQGELLTSKEMHDGICLACHTFPKGDLTIELLSQKENEMILTESFCFQRTSETEKNGYGIAVDIGTTTMAAILVDLSDGAKADETALINPQIKFGQDVFSRITYEIDHPKQGVETLQHTVADGLNKMIEKLCETNHLDNREIKQIAVSANCIMLHMLFGESAVSLGRAPYEPVFKTGRSEKAGDIGIQIAPDAEVYAPPSVSAFLGGDIVAGVYACQLQKEKLNVLFIDIGTNGEIVLSYNGHMVSCSCAAGPALEGMNISCGMRAANGAIEGIQIQDNRVKLQVIGGGEPKGICGSGLLEAITQMLKMGILSKSGLFTGTSPLLIEDGKRKKFVLCEKSGLFITQKDIRQVQLAKGAILAGIYCLLEKADVKTDEIDKVIVAGQFGAHLSIDSLIGAGILPVEFRDKIVYAGNTSLAGARTALISKHTRVEMEQLAEEIEYMDLGMTELFQTYFCQCVDFPE